VAQETEKRAEDLEQLRQRLEEYRRVRTKRGALPEQLWQEAAQAARRHGVNLTAKVLRLTYSGLKMRVNGNGDRKRKAEAAALPTFVELAGPTVGASTGCTIEVEAAQGGKLRLDLKAVTATELASLICAFMGR
jgi:hypothetical protein